MTLSDFGRRFHINKLNKYSYLPADVTGFS